VRNEIDDIDFITNGVVETFLNVFQKQDNSIDASFQKANVIATGFSNGGFMSSLLGLLSEANRPSWLVGTVPMGGYQYDANLYEGPSKPRPMPMMSHHGGRDSIVIPDGCCASADNSESNCVLDIGIKQQTCTSVQRAFEMWSHINGCSSSVLDDGTVKGRRVAKVDQDQEPILTCWKGKECIEPTNFCLWNNEGHSWGFQFPGTEMTQTWMEQIFHRAEARSRNIVKDKILDVIDDEFSMTHRSIKGKCVFISSFLVLMAIFLCTMHSATKKVMCFIIGNGRRRKSSKDIS